MPWYRMNRFDRYDEYNDGFDDGFNDSYDDDYGSYDEGEDGSYNSYDDNAEYHRGAAPSDSSSGERDDYYPHRKHWKSYHYCPKYVSQNV